MADIYEKTVIQDWYRKLMAEDIPEIMALKKKVAQLEKELEEEQGSWVYKIGKIRGDIAGILEARFVP